jgi:hypothetical protein
MDRQIKASEKTKRKSGSLIELPTRQETHGIQMIKFFKSLVKIPCNCGKVAENRGAKLCHMSVADDFS